MSNAFTFVAGAALGFILALVCLILYLAAAIAEDKYNNNKKTLN